MARRVWRFPLVPQEQPYDHEAIDDDSDDEQRRQPPAFECEIEIPEGSELIPRVKLTSRGLALYAIVDPDAERVTRTFFVCGNGIDLPDSVGSINYVDTFKRTGAATLHVFEVAKVPA